MQSQFNQYCGHASHPKPGKRSIKAYRQPRARIIQGLQASILINSPTLLRRIKPRLLAKDDSLVTKARSNIRPDFEDNKVVRRAKSREARAVVCLIPKNIISKHSRRSSSLSQDSHFTFLIYHFIRTPFSFRSAIISLSTNTILTIASLIRHSISAITNPNTAKKIQSPTVQPQENNLQPSYILNETQIVHLLLQYITGRTVRVLLTLLNLRQ